MKSFFLATLGVLCVSLAGCNSEYSEDYVYIEENHHDTYVEVYDNPEIVALELIDSYGYSSQGIGNIAVNPYVDSGWFQVNWRVGTSDDYIVEYRVNDSPTEFGSLLIDSERCGRGLSCDVDGTQFCQYRADFTLQCDADTRYAVNVEPMIFSIPQTLYFILQVCSPDYFYCEYISQPFVAE